MGVAAHTAPSHGSRLVIGLPTKLLRSKRSADEAAELSENSMKPHRISGVPLILPRGGASCVRGEGVTPTCARALRSCVWGAWPRGLGVAYCVRRMCPWNSKNERSSAEVASRWMLPTLTLVGSMAAPPSGRMAKWAIAVSVHRGWFITRETYEPRFASLRRVCRRRLELAAYRNPKTNNLFQRFHFVDCRARPRWLRTRPTTQRRRASRPDARCITPEPSPRHPITAWASRTERTQVRPRRHSARFWRQI